MTTLLRCESCGEGFECADDDFAAHCPHCGARFQPRAGSC